MRHIGAEIGKAGDRRGRRWRTLPRCRSDRFYEAGELRANRDLRRHSWRVTRRKSSRRTRRRPRPADCRLPLSPVPRNGRGATAHAAKGVVTTTRWTTAAGGERSRSRSRNGTWTLLSTVDRGDRLLRTSRAFLARSPTLPNGPGVQISSSPISGPTWVMIILAPFCEPTRLADGGRDPSAPNPLVSIPYGSLWRRDWDSNPGASFPANGFQDRRLRPLGHPSVQCPAWGAAGSMISRPCMYGRSTSGMTTEPSRRW